MYTYIFLISFLFLLASRKRCLPGVNSSGDESISEDSEYVPTDIEISSESNEISNSTNSDESEKEIYNTRRRGKQSALQKSLPKREVQNTPRTRRGCKSVAYKDYVS